jgi:hypothetical protein
LLAVLLGLLGGFGRAWQSGGLVKPSKTEEDGKTTYELGFLRPLRVGIVAGLATWLFNVSPNDPSMDYRLLGWALVAGIGGDIVLDYYLGQRYGVAGRQQRQEERQETGGVIDEVAATANTTSRELERAHDERRKAQQRVADLEEEVERLKNTGASDD